MVSFPTASSPWAIRYPGKLEVPAPTGHNNQTWDPELRMEALDTDRIWIACLFMTLVSITIVVAQDRHYSPAEPPHTKAYSIINPVPLLPQPNGSKQQSTWVLLFYDSQMQC